MGGPPPTGSAPLSVHEELVGGEREKVLVA
jgi:hypothetical protein